MSAFGAMNSILEAQAREDMGNDKQFVKLSDPESKKVKDKLSMAKTAWLSGAEGSVIVGGVVFAGSLILDHFFGASDINTTIDAALGLGSGLAYGCKESSDVYGDLECAANHMIKTRKRPITAVPGFFDTIEPNDERLVQLHKSKPDALGLQ